MKIIDQPKYCQEYSLPIVRSSDLRLDAAPCQSYSCVMENKSGNLSEPLRQAILGAIENGSNSHRLAKAAGVQQGQIDRFVSGERVNLSIITADKLAGALGLRLTAAKQRRKKE